MHKGSCLVSYLFKYKLRLSEWLIFQTRMLKHSFQSNTLRSRGEGESDDSSSSSEEEQVEFNRRQRIKLKEEKVKTELEAELARDIWQQQTGSRGVGVDLISDRWKGFGEEKVKAELERDIWKQQADTRGVRNDPDSDKWKGFGADLSKLEKDKCDVGKEERELREQHLCLTLLGLLLVFCLILYGVLLHFILKASTC